MSLRAFLIQLQETGQVTVANVGRAAAAELSGVDPVLQAIDRDARLEWPGTPPPLDAEAAHWGAVMLYRGCQFLVCRNVPSDLVVNTLSLGCPSRQSPSAAYSVDLCLRYLPDLFALARGTAPNDSLVESLRLLAVGWPLSSVGMPGLGEVIMDLDMFWQDRSLRTLYVDRIVASGDTSRLNQPSVRVAVRAALGACSDRAPAIARAITEGDSAA